MDDLLSQLQQISLDLYRQVSGLNSDTLRCYGLQYSPESVPSFPIPDLALDIPPPDYLVEQLCGLGTPYKIANELSCIHSRKAKELAKQYQQSYHDSCLELTMSRELPNANDQQGAFLRLQFAARRSFSETISLWAGDVCQRLRNRLSTLHSRPNSRQKFNYVCSLNVCTFYQAHGHRATGFCSGI